MTELTFTKDGSLYYSNPIFGNGNSVVKYQIGYKKAGARFIVERSYSPTSGWQLIVDMVSPAMPQYIVGNQMIPSGMYIRFRTDVEPDEVNVDITADGSSTPSVPTDVIQKIETLTDKVDAKLETIYVDELPNVEDAKTNIIYSVKNNAEEEGNVYDEFIFKNGKYERLGSAYASVTENDIQTLFNK